jgi:parallel beta-helix repeat protein
MDISMNFMRGLPRLLIVCLLGMFVALIAVSSVQSEGSAQAANKVAGPGESIQAAINAADPGDTIVVRGVHREDVVIRKNGIKLRGVDNAVIEAPTRAKADSPCSKLFGPEAICVLGDVNSKTGKVNRPISDVSISGFTIRGFKQKATIMIDVIGARNTTIAGNHVMGNAGAGIGITAEGLNNTIKNNDLTDNEDDGVFVEGQRNTTIANNTFTGNAIGMEVDKNIDTLIKGNDVTGGFVSILTEDSKESKILSNTMHRYDDLGLLVGGPKRANAKVIANDISGGDFGIFVTNSHRGTFAANKVYNNCAGLVFAADLPEPGNSVGNYQVMGNKVENNTKKCPAVQGRAAFSGIGIGLFGAQGMEVRTNHLSGNIPSGPTAISGGIVVAVDPLFGTTTKPKNNSVVANNFGRNKPDIFFDESGTGNRFRANNCNKSIPAGLCN